MWIVIAVVVVLVLVAVVGLRAVRGVDPTTLSLDPALIGEVRALAVSGQPGAAVKRLRQGVPGLSLVHATNMVQRMIPRDPPPTSGPPAASGGQ